LAPVPACALFGFGFPLLALLLTLRLLLRLWLGLCFLRRGREIADSFEGHARRRREDRRWAWNSLTARTRARWRRWWRRADTHVINIEQIVFIAAHEFRARHDEQIVTAFACIEEGGIRGARPSGQEINTT